MDEETANRAMNTFFKVWVEPEVEKRIAEGKLPKGVVINMAQVLLPKDGHAIVRVNDEVRLRAMVAVKQAVKEGDAVFQSDLQNIKFMDLIEAELDYGHVTMIAVGEKWAVSFNFLRERNRAGRLVDLAEGFMRTAQFAFDNNLIPVSIDNLFSCFELLAKAHTVVNVIIDAKGKSHDSVGSAINRWGKLGNVNAEFVALLNQMANARAAARYEGVVKQNAQPTQEAFEIAKREIALLRRRWIKADMDSLSDDEEIVVHAAEDFPSKT